MNTNNITTTIDKYVKYNGQYWATGENESTLSSTNLGISTESGNENSYYNYWQCQGFAHFFATVLFGSCPLTDNEGRWETHSTNLTSFELQPGDYIKTTYYYDNDGDGILDKNDHAAIVWKIKDGEVYVVEVWGGYGNVINFGVHNGGRGDMVKVENLLEKLDFVYRFVGEVTNLPEPPEDTPTPTTVTVTFHMNRPGVANDSTEETTQTIGGTYNFPDEDVPTGYEFAGWYTSATGGTRVDNNSTVDGEVENLYAHWEAKRVDENFI